MLFDSPTFKITFVDNYDPNVTDTTFIPTVVGFSSFRHTNDSSFRYTNDEQNNYSNQRPHRRKWTREDNKLALYCYFRSNSKKRGYRKRMIEILTEFARFKIANQRLAEKVRTITNNGWFSDLEILEIYQQIYRQTYQQTLYTVSETLNIEKPETPNHTINDNDRYTANTKPQTLTQEEKINVEIMKKIIPEKKTTLPSLRNQDERTVKFETVKVNDLLTNIPENNITELNDLIYAGAKLVCEKIGVPLKTTDGKFKPGWELRLELQIRKLWQQARILKRNMKIYSDEGVTHDN